MRSATATAQVMQRLGYRISLIASDGNASGERLTSAQSMEATGLRTHLFRTRYAERFGFGWGAAAVLFREIAAAHVVYISGVFTWPTTLAGWITALRGKPYIVCPHGGLLKLHLEELRERKYLKYLVYKALVVPIVRKAAIVRVSSEFEASDLLSEFPSANVLVVPNAFDLSCIPYCAENQGASGRRFIYVGRIEPDKGIRAFLQTWCRVATADDTMTIVGSGDGIYAQEVAALSKSDPRIIVTGELDRPAVIAQITLADILVLPSGLEGSLRENFGNVVVEALAIGRPVLVSRGLAWDEIDAHGVGITAIRSDEGMSSAIGRAINEDWVVREDTRAACRAYAVSRFDTSAVERAVRAMVEKLAPRGNLSESGTA